MAISVVIPAYNASSYLAETLESALAQTLAPDEIVLVDDGSTDNTAVIAERYAPQVRVVHGTHAGPSAARNLGVRESASEWIAFLDADDLWEPGKLQRQMEELNKNVAADVCYTARRHFSEPDGRRVMSQKPIEVPLTGELRTALYRNTTFLPSSVMIRKSAFLSVGGFDEQLSLVEDWELWLRLLHAGVQFAACREALMLYRVHSQNVSQKALELLASADQVYCRHVLPYLPGLTRSLRYRRVLSEHEAAAAINLRLGKDLRYLSTMLRSIARDPFHGPHRYKVFAHMLYTSLKAKRSSR